MKLPGFSKSSLKRTLSAESHDTKQYFNLYRSIPFLSVLKAIYSDGCWDSQVMPQMPVLCLSELFQMEQPRRLLCPRTSCSLNQLDISRSLEVNSRDVDKTIVQLEVAVNRHVLLQNVLVFVNENGIISKVFKEC